MAESDDNDGDQDVQEWAEDNFKAMKQKLEDFRDEMRNSKPRENINVRRVEMDDEDDQIVVEHSVQRWYSINYFKKMMQEQGNQNQQDNEDTLF